MLNNQNERIYLNSKLANTNTNTNTNLNNYNNNPSLSNPKNLILFITCLKSLHKQQENKKKNYKKLMNLFSVRVQKYDDSSSHNKTDEKFKVRKCELNNKINKKKKYCNNQPKTSANLKPNKKVYDSSNMDIVEDNYNLYQNYDTIINNQVEIESVNEDGNKLECNSDSSIFTHHKESNIDSDDEGDNENENGYHNGTRKRRTKSMNKNKNIMNERAKFIKHKFTKQMDIANSKKFCNEDNVKFSKIENDLSNNNNFNLSNSYNNFKNNSNNLNYLYVNNNYNINIDTSLYNSYRSVNSTDRNNNSKISESLVNYLINNIEDDKDLIFYNKDESSSSKFKYDENYKCYYSLDHKSRIIYIKPSPTLLSSISSILNSKIISNKATHNISNEASVISLTPKAKDNTINIENNLSLNILNFNHNIIIEKLKNLELLRKDKDKDIDITKTIVSSPENEDEDDSENIN